MLSAELYRHKGSRRTAAAMNHGAERHTHEAAMLQR